MIGEFITIKGHVAMWENKKWRARAIVSGKEEWMTETMVSPECDTEAEARIKLEEFKQILIPKLTARGITVADLCESSRKT